MDGELKLHKHITEKCRIASDNLYSIRCIRDTLTVEACKQVVQSLVISHLDYCNLIFMDMPEKEINGMQKIQNSAACLILNRSRWSSASSALKDLHWLPIRARIKFKVLIQVFKCLKSQAPQYLIDKLVVRILGESVLQSSSERVLLEIPVTKYKTFAERTFLIYGPKRWNILPKYVREVEELKEFRKKLKTYLFRQYFNSQ